MKRTMMLACCSAVALLACAQPKPGQRVTAGQEQATVDEKHSEKYVKERFTAVYNRAGKELSARLDADYCSGAYNELNRECQDVSEREGLVYRDYDHWLMGQERDPQWDFHIDQVTIKDEKTATVRMVVHNFEDQELMLSLIFEGSDWYIDDFIVLYKEEGSVWEVSEKIKMQRFLNGQSISVSYEGSQPTIKDFVSALLSGDDLGEVLNGVKRNWMRYENGAKMASDVTLKVDAANGFVRHEYRIEPGSYNYTEFCCWNCKEQGTMLVAVNIGCVSGGKVVEGEHTGLALYRYSKYERCLDPVPAEEYGALIDSAAPVTYVLPQKGKDIKATIHGKKGKKQVLLKWNGAGFVQTAMVRKK